MLIRHTGKLMAVYSERFKMLRSYGDVLNFPFQTCAANEVTAEVYIDFVDPFLGPPMTKEAYSQLLWDKVLCFGILFFDRRLKLHFIDGLLLRTWAPTRQLGYHDPRSDHYTITRKA